MARLPKKQREERDAKILADWKAGYSQNQLAKNYDVSPATVNKICKGVEQSNKDIVNAQVAINTEIASKSEYEVNSIHKAVDERTKQLMFFQNSAMKNQQMANEALEAIDYMKKEAKDEKERHGLALQSLDVMKDHATITAKNKETVLGRETANTTVNVQNNNTAVTVSGDEVTDAIRRKFNS